MATTSRKKPAPKNPAPLTLKGSKLEDFLPLLPAEEKLRQCVANGEECIVGDFSGERPKEATELNTVRAEFLRYMILGGCESSVIHARGIILNGAFIHCNKQFDLEASNICNDLKLHQCMINGNLLLSALTLKIYL